MNSPKQAFLQSLRIYCPAWRLTAGERKIFLQPPAVRLLPRHRTARSEELLLRIYRLAHAAAQCHLAPLAFGLRHAAGQQDSAGMRAELTVS